MPLASDIPPSWNSFDLSERPLDLDATLLSGQAFRWRRDRSGIWWGAIAEAAVALWQRSSAPFSPLYWQTFPVAGQQALVEEYLRLESPLPELYRAWKRSEPRIAGAIAQFEGLRILRQPPVECFFGFQCATCNTVVKIQRTVFQLARRYGKPITVPAGVPFDAPSAASQLPTEPHSPSGPEQAPTLTEPLETIYSFPSIEALAAADETELRSDLWGYRAPRVIALASRLHELGPGWLESLRARSFGEARTALAAFHGIGEKVADCICLFSLDKDEAVPVDTHVRQIALRLFDPQEMPRSLTSRAYAAIADAYRDRFGAYAGWAQQYLFLDAMMARRRDADRLEAGRPRV